MKRMTDIKRADREIIVTRIFNAPRERVFEAWTDPEHIGEWWGPNGFTTKTDSIDVRPGGEWRYVMYGPNGMAFPNRMIYDEVVKPERLVYRHDTGIENDPDRFHVTVTFEAQDGKTKLTMYSLFPSAAQLDKVVREFHALEGAEQHVGRLAAYLGEV